MNLKPCPFCGGEIRIVRLHGSYGEPWYARCDRCEVSSYYYKTEAQAIEEWSVRPERTCRMVDAYCSECGKPDPSSGDAEYCAYCGAKVVS